ncbi:RidA family protein [Amycolatopsis sp. Poz14]|uniref:RidA family protein n=1 Tax=Amycolatopsis sp. Poz14 TaxID=1447705 RepID=UPI001EE8B687|nr:RidA family protein [Amycolatopsis sp. Poz14]MCG3754076.1 RidA family protein [Amycolatopsis sp. Poz14]
MTTYLEQRKHPGSSSGSASGDFVFASAVAIDPATMRRIPEARTVAEETRAVLALVEDHLAQAGCGLRDVVKTTCYVSEETDRMEFIQAYRDVFAPGPYPARCTVVMGIAGDCRVQVDAIAYRGAQQ